MIFRHFATVVCCMNFYIGTIRVLRGVFPKCKFSVRVTSKCRLNLIWARLFFVWYVGGGGGVLGQKLPPLKFRLGH